LPPGTNGWVERQRLLLLGKSRHRIATEPTVQDKQQNEAEACLLVEQGVLYCCTFIIVIITIQVASPWTSCACHVQPKDHSRPGQSHGRHMSTGYQDRNNIRVGDGVSLQRGQDRQTTRASRADGPETTYLLRGDRRTPRTETPACMHHVTRLCRHTRQHLPCSLLSPYTFYRWIASCVFLP
jgi:hypothetical protein